MRAALARLLRRVADLMDPRMCGDGGAGARDLRNANGQPVSIRLAFAFPSLHPGSVSAAHHSRDISTGRDA